MNLRQIEAFKAVLETGTVTQAAVRLSISQPAVSKLLHLFERNAAMELFTRDRGRLVPTPEAHLLYEEVERVFQSADRIRQAAEDIRSLKRGKLSVGVMPGLSVGFAQEVIARMQQTHPDFRTVLHARESPQLLHQMAMRQIEVLYSTHVIDMPELRTQPLCRLPLVCILPRGHVLAAKPVICCEDLQDARFASFHHDSSLRQRIDQVFEDAKVSRNLAFEAPTAPSLCAFVARGLGISIVSPLYIGAFRPALVVRPFSPSILFELRMATPKSRPLSRLGKAFAEQSRKLGAELEKDPDTLTKGYDWGN